MWGGSFFFNGVVLRELPPFTVVFLRVTLAALMLLPLLWLYRIRFPDSLPGWRPFISIGLLNNVLPFSLIVVGQTYIPGGLASILNATTPLFTVLVMAIAGEEKLSARRIAGVIVGLIGVVILHGDGLGLESGEGVGILLCLAAAFSYGLSALLARRLLSDSPPLGTATFQMLASAAMMTIVAGLVERPWQLPMPGLSTWLAVIGLAALSTALAYIVFFQILRRSGATNVMLVTLLIPVTAIGRPGARRENLAAGDCGRARDRQRITIDRWARAEILSALSDLSPTLPFVIPAGKSAAIPLAAMPGRMDFAVACHQHHDVEPLGAAQRIDRLLRGLRNRSRDIEGCVDGKLDADMAA